MFSGAASHHDFYIIFLVIFSLKNSKPLHDGLIFLSILLPTLYFDTALGFSSIAAYGWALSACGLVALHVSSGQRFEIDRRLILLAAIIAAYFVARYILVPPVSSRSLKNTLMIGFGCVLTPTLVHVYNQYSDATTRAIKLCLALHLTVMVAQLIAWYGWGYDLDIGNALGGEGHRSLQGDLYRPTGVFDEPALYAMVMAGLCIALYVRQRKMTTLWWAGMISLVLTSSLLALVVFFLILLFINIRVGLIAIVVYFGGQYFLSQIIPSDAYSPLGHAVTRSAEVGNNNDPSTQVKFQVIEEFLKTPTLWATGYGLEGYISGDPMYYQALNDLTFPITTLTTYGLVVGIVILLIFSAYLFTSYRPSTLLLIGVFLLKGAYFHLPFLWLFFAISPDAIAAGSAWNRWLAWRRSKRHDTDCRAVRQA